MYKYLDISFIVRVFQVSVSKPPKEHALQPVVRIIQEIWNQKGDSFTMDHDSQEVVRDHQMDFHKII